MRMQKPRQPCCSFCKKPTSEMDLQIEDNDGEHAICPDCVMKFANYYYRHYDRIPEPPSETKH